MANPLIPQMPPVPDVIDGIWKSESARVISKQTQVLAFPIAMKAIIGQQGIDEIARRFQ